RAASVVPPRPRPPPSATIFPYTTLFRSVVGSASSGRIALMKIPLLLPDVVLLDIDMPEMSGLETLSAIRQLWPRLPVVILNVATDRKSTRLNSSHVKISYAVFCLKKKRE